MISHALYFLSSENGELVQDERILLPNNIKKDATKAKITCNVSIGPRDGGGLGLSVAFNIEDTQLPQQELEAYVKEAHEKVCPYSHATRGNVEVVFKVKGA